jgi:hypothetical protein
MKTQSKTISNPLCLIFLSVLMSGMISGCVTNIPVDEYTIARAAYEAARDADSSRFAPAIWFKAEQTYREAEKAFRERRYSVAKDLFEQAQELSEKAEELSMLARHQSGEIIP